jgi:hypothetical protein
MCSASVSTAVLTAALFSHLAFCKRLHPKSQTVPQDWELFRCWCGRHRGLEFGHAERELYRKLYRELPNIACGKVRGKVASGA